MTGLLTQAYGSMRPAFFLAGANLVFGAAICYLASRPRGTGGRGAA